MYHLAQNARVIVKLKRATQTKDNKRHKNVRRCLLATQLLTRGALLDDNQRPMPDILFALGNPTQSTLTIAMSGA